MKHELYVDAQTAGRALEIAAYIMDKSDMCIGEDRQQCPAFANGAADCQECIAKFLYEKARQELRSERNSRR